MFFAHDQGNEIVTIVTDCLLFVVRMYVLQSWGQYKAMKFKTCVRNMLTLA